MEAWLVYQSAALFPRPQTCLEVVLSTTENYEKCVLAAEEEGWCRNVFQVDTRCSFDSLLPSCFHELNWLLCHEPDTLMCCLLQA